MTDLELTQLVQEALLRAMEEGTPEIRKPWLVHSIIEGQARLAPDTADFYVVCAYRAISAIVGDVIRKYRKSESAQKAQLALPGFQRLQTHYQIDRDGSCIVAIGEMTDHEITVKAAELKGMAQGLLRHADELLKYCKQRRYAVL